MKIFLRNLSTSLSRLPVLFYGLVCLFLPFEAQAQVTVTFADQTVTIGQEITIPVVLSNVEAGNAIQAFQLTIDISDTNISFVGGSYTGTVVESWTSTRCIIASNYCDGFYAGIPDSTSGTLVFLTFSIDAAVSAATIALTDMKLNGNLAPAITPAVPTATITVTSAPIASDDAYTVAEGSTLTEDAAAGVLANDSDPDGDPMTAALVAGPSNGTLTLNADGSFTYTHNGSETTSDSFTYQANDGAINSNTATVTITVTAVNDAPVSSGVSATTDEDASVDIPLSATDADGDDLTYSIVSNPSNGSVSIAGATATYTPAAGYFGSDSFTYSANDGTVDSNVSTVTVTVNEVNEAPMAGNDTYLVDEDDSLDITAANGVLSNDTDADGNTLTAVLVTGPANGSLSLASDGSFTYTPDADYNGIDSFTYQANDGQALSGVATVIISVQPTGSTDLQFVHSGGDGLPAMLDVYYDGALVARDLALRAATAAVSVPDGDATIKLAEAPSTGIGDAFVDFNVSLAEDGFNVAVFAGAGGVAAGSRLVVTEGRTTATDVGAVDLKLIHASQTTPALDVRAISDAIGHPVLFSFVTALAYESVSAFQSRAPDTYLMEASESGQSASIYDVYRFDFSSDAGSYFSMIAAGQQGGPAGDEFTLLAVEVDGTVRFPTIVTAVEEDSFLPRTFVLRGNYPNPFNPRTTIQFDLPEPAEVEISILDLLGRTMLVVPAQSLPAGANQTVPVDATSLASGIYIYRVVARSVNETQIATGTMTLIK